MANSKKSKKKGRKIQDERQDNQQESEVWRSTKVIVNLQEDFENVLSTNLRYSWHNRAAEFPLYALYDHIFSHICSTVQPPGYPGCTLSFGPQASFDVRTPPGKNAKPLSKEARRRLYPKQTPDYVRTIIGDGSTFDSWKSLPVDFAEIKPLNTEGSWFDSNSQRSALEEIPTHLDQVYTQAMAAFAHNPHWPRVYVLLIIGVYFSQFVWDRPLETIKPPLRVPSVNRVLNSRESNKVVERYEAKIREYEARTLPRIEYYNAPVLLLNPATKERPNFENVSLSPQFLYALRLPLKKEHSGCKFQNSWISSPGRKPLNPLKIVPPINEVERALKTQNINRLQGALRSIREGTQSPPAKRGTKLSKDAMTYQPSHSVRKAVQMTPIVDRPKRALHGVANLKVGEDISSGDDAPEITPMGALVADPSGDEGGVAGGQESQDNAIDPDEAPGEANGSGPTVAAEGDGQSDAHSWEEEGVLDDREDEEESLGFTEMESAEDPEGRGGYDGDEDGELED